MLDKFLDDYVNKMYLNSNINMSLEQRNLYKKDDYYVLLKPVVLLLKKYPDYSLEELRNKLFEESGLREKIKKFIYEDKMTPGAVITYGTNNYRETLVIGNREEVVFKNGKIIPSIKEMTYDTIFDLASITKLFTSVSILLLVSKGMINLDDKIVKYASNFKNLRDVSIYDLLSFKVPLKTSKRLDDVSFMEAKDILNNIEVSSLEHFKNPYTDMGAIVLKYVIENASGMPFYDFLDKEILSPLLMQDTNYQTKYKLDRVASTTLGGIITNDGFIRDTTGVKGLPHDKKARVLLPDGMPGHAGLFSTAKDMSLFAKGLINKQVLPINYLDSLAVNRTGKKVIVDGYGKYVQYLGYLCYLKHPNLKDSELFHAMSGKSFASAGFTGGELTIDPLNEIYFFLGTNRVHNRIIRNTSGKDIKELEVAGSIIPNASKFAWQRDEYLVHPCLKLAIQYKMLEDFYKLCKEKIPTKEITKKL